MNQYTVDGNQEEQKVEKPEREISRFRFMANCIWWMSEFMEGRAKIRDAQDAARKFLDHCNDIIVENNL